MYKKVDPLYAAREHCIFMHRETRRQAKESIQINTWKTLMDRICRVITVFALNKSGSMNHGQERLLISHARREVAQERLSLAILIRLKPFCRNNNLCTKLRLFRRENCVFSGRD